ncbi:MAG: carboxypeptidase regulatory-like domain-containing protein [Terriglobia bacterium]
MLLAFLLLLRCPLLRAQSSLTPLAPSGGTLTGQVSGPGNVPVPGARVILFNPQTRSRKETWSDSSGNYTFTGVPAGQYRVVVMLVGFRPSLLGPVDIPAGASMRVNASLALAQPREPSSFGNLGTGANGGPGGNAGKGALAQRSNQAGTAGTAGAVGTAGQSGQSIPSAGGAAGQSSEQELSSIMGAAASGGGSGANAGLRFSQDDTSAAGATQAAGEVEAAGGSTDAGGSAGAGNSFLLSGNVVDATAPAMQRGGMRRYQRFGGGGPAGSPFGGGGGGRGFIFFGGGGRPRVNRLRGNFFDNYTNSAFDARPFALNAPPQPKLASYREQLGFSLGGPLTIPKIYNGGNKTSFFVHFNTTRAKTPYNLFESVPTLAERGGDFSNTLITSGPFAGTVPTIFKPSGSPGPRTPFPGNQIPSTMINSAAAGLLAYVPLPNLAGQTQNYHVQGSLPLSNQMIMGRIGQQFSAKDNLSVFYFYNSSHTHGVTNFPDITSETTTRNQNLSVTESHTFSPHLVNILSANFNRTRSDAVNPFAFKQNIAGELGILGVSQDPMDWGLPSIGFTNFSGLSDVAPSLTRNQTFRFSDFVIINRGKHNLHVGGDVSKIQVNTLSNPQAAGRFSFTGYTTSDFTSQGTPLPGTGYDLADFLLGLPQTTSERFGSSANYLRSSRYSAYGSDDWRTTNHLTLDLGGRWEYAAPFTEKYGRLSDLNLGPGFSTAGVVTGQKPGSLPSSLLHGHADHAAPRIGIAYRPWISHSLVVRAGYGIFYDESVYHGLVDNLVNQAPFATTSTLVTSPTQNLTLQNGFPAINPGVVHNTFAVDPFFLTPYAQSWNLMLEQDLSPSYVLSMAYIGTRGTHLNLLLAPNVAVPATSGSGQGLIPNAQPFEYETSGAESNYNGLRVSLRHFSRKDFSFFLNYTYSKSMDNASSVGGAGGLPVQNPFNLRAEWALSSFNPTHSVRAFTRYQLPFGDRKHFLNHGGAMAKILGNWSLSDVTSYSSGLPFTAMLSGNLSNNVKGSAPFGGLRAQATGLPVSLSGSAQTTLAYFNTLAFALPPAGEYGDAGRNTIPGIPSLNFNVAVDRLVTISREKGLSADFRVASNNTFNIVNYEGLATTVNSNTFGRVLGAGSMRTISLSMRFRF